MDRIEQAISQARIHTNETIQEETEQFIIATRTRKNIARRSSEEQSEAYYQPPMPTEFEAQAEPEINEVPAAQLKW